jgi:hypothetical protein
VVVEGVYGSDRARALEFMSARIGSKAVTLSRDNGGAHFNTTQAPTYA